MKIDPEQIEALGRGGRPTLSELLDHLVFRPVDARISLAGARMVMQRASVGANLRDTLVQRLGPREAMVILMRIGYRAGLEDAEFVRAAWPNINVGDAFTAGTRLHMLSGVVRVETLSNDFDFDRHRYASEFLWHGSAEAVEHHRLHGRSDAPVCWMQTGYAAGYASFFFRRLVVYKENRCAAMGHKHCDLVGRTAEHWGADDPVVRMFREEIVPTGDIPSRRPPRGSQGLPAATAPGAAPEDRLAAALAAPMAQMLERIATAGVPALIHGPQGSGQGLVARHLARRLCAAHQPVITADCAGASFLKTLGDLPAPEGTIAGTIAGPQPCLILENLESLPADAQSRLRAFPGIGARVVAGPRPSHLPIIATSALPPDRLVTERGLPADLVYALSTFHAALPPLAGHPGLPDICAALLDRAAADTGRPRPDLPPAAMMALSGLPLPGNLFEITALMTAAVLDPSTLDDIAAAAAQAPIHRDAPDVGRPETAADPTVENALTAAIGTGPIDIDDIMRLANRTALTRAGGNVAQAARRLGLTRAQLDYRLRNDPLARPTHSGDA